MKHVLIDSGYLKYASYYVAQRNLKCDDFIQLAKHPKTFEQIYDALSRMLSTKLRQATSILGNLDTVQICIDDGVSWRASLSAPSTPDEKASGIIYKSHRHDVEDKEMMNARWRLNQWYLEAIKTISELNHFIVHELRHVEADDILTVRGKQLADQGHFVLTMSHDYDVTQSIYSNKETGGHVVNCYIGNYGNPDKFFITHELSNAISELTIFGNPNFLRKDYFVIFLHIVFRVVLRSFNSF